MMNILEMIAKQKALRDESIFLNEAIKKLYPPMPFLENDLIQVNVNGCHKNIAVVTFISGWGAMHRKSLACSINRTKGKNRIANLNFELKEDGTWIFIDMSMWKDACHLTTPVGEPIDNITPEVQLVKKTRDLQKRKVKRLDKSAQIYWSKPDSDVALKKWIKENDWYYS